MNLCSKKLGCIRGIQGVWLYHVGIQGVFIYSRPEDYTIVEAPVVDEEMTAVSFHIMSRNARKPVFGFSDKI